MSQLILLVLAIYSVMVGYHGHSSQLFGQLGKDLPGFAPWIIAIILLGILAVNQDTEKLGKPLLGLIAIGLVLHNWSTISATSKKFYSEVTT